MKTRNTMALLFAGMASLAGTFTSDADAALVGATCNVTTVGWREDIKALKVTCGATTFWNRESVGGSNCTFKTSMDAIKVFQTTANAALLSGRSVKLYYETQGVCSSDYVIREMYLLN